MSPQFRVLSISSDPLLFETRNRVMQLAGFEVVPCFHGDNAEETFVRSQVDAVVIDDSLSPPQKVALIRKFRVALPRIPILVVYPVGLRTVDVPLADAAVESLDGPEALIHALQSVIGKKKAASDKLLYKAASNGQ